MINFNGYFGQRDGDFIQQQDADMVKIDCQIGRIPAYHRGNAEADTRENVNAGSDPLEETLKNIREFESK